MMNFRVVKEQIISILTAAEAGRYVTIGSQRQSKAAKENLNLPRVTAYYRTGDFPKTSSNFESVKMHDATYWIEFTVVQEAEVDLSVLTNPASTPAQIAAALAAMPILSDQVDDSMDEVYDNVYQVLMDARNYDLGLPIGQVTDRYIDNFQKDDPLPKGEYMVLTGRCQLTCRMEEIVDGDTGTPGANSDTTVNINEDQSDNMGVSDPLPT